MRIRKGLVDGVRLSVFAAVLVLPLSFTADLGAQVSVSLSVTPDVQSSCEAEDVRVALSAENPSGLEIAGFQFFLEYPADKLEPVAYEVGDVAGLVAVNGVSPFGVGFDGCGADQADPWADGLGRDRVALVASVFAEGNPDSVTAGTLDLGIVVFQLRPDAPLGVDEIRFPTNGCSPFFANLHNVFDASGRPLGLLFDNAFDDFEVEGYAAVEDFTCETNDEGTMTLSWNPPSAGGADGFVVYKNGEKFRIAPTTAFTEFEDEDPPGCGEQALYEVAVVSGGVEEACAVSCRAAGPDGGSDFIRGDVDSSGRMNITDAINLNLLLFAGNAVKCQDAADYDDSGFLDTTDTIGLLLFQFSTGPPPAAPYPDPGQDPTDDDDLEPCCLIDEA